VSLVTADLLQTFGWALTVLGHVLVAKKARLGFAIWVLANSVMVASAVRTGLWWNVGMHLASVGVCLWAYRRWGLEGRPMRSLFIKRAAR
jgi:hypothetical protein